MPEVDIDDAGDATVAWEGAAGVVAATGGNSRTVRSASTSTPAATNHHGRCNTIGINRARQPPKEVPD